MTYSINYGSLFKFARIVLQIMLRILSAQSELLTLGAQLHR